MVFEGSWLNAFAEERTAPAPFRTLDGAQVSAPTMHGNVRTSYATGDGWAAVRLAYAGGYSMLVVLPDEGRFAEVEGRAAAVLAEAGATRNDHGVELALPRFSFAASADLVPVLRDLGLTEIFEADQADLTGISPEGDLHVSGIAHQATVDVDEHGTTATAATGILVGVTSMPEPASLVVDRPFIVAIEQDSTGELLFLGRVTDPTA
jgi:serpin B